LPPVRGERQCIDDSIDTLVERSFAGGRIGGEDLACEVDDCVGQDTAVDTRCIVAGGTNLALDALRAIVTSRTGRTRGTGGAGWASGAVVTRGAGRTGGATRGGAGHLTDGVDPLDHHVVWYCSRPVPPETH
jgi:hypothetical protein